ncbi:MAG TPA: tetratricopeptide repeat protein [Rhodanobacteraceae bacterium]|nr:tetratricopeptide repeat protein [Rhodanobacteraceae bacterium]
MAGMQGLPSGTPASAWRWGEYLLRPSQRRLLRGGDPVEVEDRVFDLLVLLLEHRERPLDRQEVIAAIWGRRPVSDATLRQLVYKARRAIGDDGEHQTTIATLYGRSLQWVAPVEAVFEAAGRPSALAPTASGAGSSRDEGIEAEKPPARIGAARIHRWFVPQGRKWLALALMLLVAVGLVAAWVVRESNRDEPPRISASGSPAATPISTLAVLPFVDLDPQHDPRYLSDGLTEELIFRLARMPRLRVTARTSSFVFRDKAVDVREAARRLGVAHVLEGSVQPSGNRLRVRVALVDARNGYELWTDEYDAGEGDLLNMEDHIARDVVATLYPKLVQVSAAVEAREAHVDTAAHDAYLVGMEYLNRRTQPDLEQAIAYFQRAAAADATYARAWVGLAVAYAVWSDYDSDDPPDKHYQDARAAAARAVALDHGLAHAHAVLGLLYMHHWQWPQAVGEYQRALQLDPSDASAHQWYAMYLWYMGDMAGALAQMRFAHRLDPLSPIINADLGRALLYAGHPDQAVAQYREAIALDPRFPLAHIFLAESYMAQNRNAQALQETRAAIAMSPSPVPSSYMAMLGVALSQTGDEAGARAQLAALEARSRNHYVSEVSLAFLGAQLGQTDQVFARLSLAERDHDPLMQPVMADRSAGWHADPRFAQLRTRMGLPAH